MESLYLQRIRRDKRQPSFQVKEIQTTIIFPSTKEVHIYQYEYNFNPEKSDRYVNKNTDKVKTGRGFAFKNRCYKDYRLVIRTIAGSTNERSLISAIIPKNSFITNKLHGS